MVNIQPPEGNSIWLDFATHAGGRNDRAGRCTSFYTTPGSSIWGPRQGVNSRVNNLENHTTEPQVLTVLCWVSSYHCRPRLEYCGIQDSPWNGIIRENEGLFRTWCYARCTGRICCDVWCAGQSMTKTSDSESSTQNARRDRFHHSPQTCSTPKWPWSSSTQHTGWMHSRRSNGPQSRWRRMSAGDMAQKIVNGRCLYSGGITQGVVECAAGMKAQMFKMPAAEVKEVETARGSEESGNDYFNQRMMALWLMEQVLCLMIRNVLEFCVFQLSRRRYWKDW